MKKLKIITFIILVFASISCSKDIDNDVITGTWELISLHSDKDISKEKDNTYTITFTIDNLVSMKLDVNSCSSDYILKGDNEIAFGSFLCTKICCDTEYANEFVNIVESATNVSLFLDKLILEGDKGKVKLKRK